MNWCYPCFRRGLPCSWTRPDWVGGPNWNTLKTGKSDRKAAGSRTFSGAFWKVYYEAVYAPCVPAKALQPVDVPEPGYMLLRRNTTDAAGKEDEDGDEQDPEAMDYHV